MTISNTSRSAGPFIGNGVTKAFPFSYKVFSREDVLVATTVTATKVETILVLDADYTVTLNSDQNSNPGGMITLTNALAVGSTLAATSNISLVQALDLTNQGGFYPKVINDALDRIVINIQQLAGKIGNGLGIGMGAITDQALAALVAVQQFGTATGAKLVGYMQAGTGAVLRTIEAKNREVVSPEDFGAVGDGVTDDAPAIQRAINSFPNAASCAVRLTPNRTYRLGSQVNTNNRSVVIDGNNAILLVAANMTCALNITGTNCEVRNVQVNRLAGVVATAAIIISGLQHVIRNVTSRAQTWALFMLCQDMKESHITNLRVDNDVTNRTGIVVQFDYCVNNTVSNSMVGFCAQAFYGSSTGQPTSGYHTEGILFNNVITVYAGKAVNMDNGTFIAISNCCFDFCETIGVFMSNGTDLMVSNTWIASNLTNGFIGIGTLAGVEGVSVQNNTLVRGAGAITGTAGVSLPGPSALVIGNRFRQGMNGGVITQMTSQAIGNSVTGGGTNIVSNNSISTVLGSMSVEKDLTVAVGGTLTVGGSKGIFPTALSGSASAGANGAPPASVGAYATVVVAGTTYKLPLYNP